MSYTNKASIQNYLMITISNSFSTQIDNWIKAAENYINNYCNRTSFTQELATVKYYDGSGSNELLIDDLLTCTKIEILDDDSDVQATLDSTDEYFLYPANKTPKTRIVINSTNASISVFLTGHQNIKITGTWGYSVDVPEDIRLAATKIVAGIISERNFDVAGDIKSESLGEYAVTFQDVDAISSHLKIKEDLLNRYRVITVM